ncbi:MAG: hypothetical protein A2Y67_02675 [Candidatus Buchananbacteria bacterium RBG_13_39_9]|uniref:Transposase IS200-like domain-containing protein n=1 Tax=Candidatus Buchananbacteria bacterium RBG_13_39_9 TaxID=1797531 RepID=A0A1G1XPA6_9BACT|nr:MAG: hypothetical protein A2Y67_02675 [Candidatus Buchananbacteria bacterium RBG_13_39_9]
MRKVKFTNGEYYHIYNRGVDKRDVFLDEGDYIRFLKYIKEILSSEAKPFSRRLSLEGAVELICYCLNPNHFHFILRQLRENGISNFMHLLATSYTMFFNTKYHRSGSLFQGPFKAVEIDSNEDLLWVSAYVNANAQIHGLIKDASNYKWCSYPEYLGLSPENFCHKDIIINQFRDKEDFKKFMNDCVITMKEKKELQKYLID